MAGHSQFKNIMHRKGRQDAAKSKLFGKLAREITVSAKMGMPDPAIEAGADDVVSSESGHEIYAGQASFHGVAKTLEAKFGEPRKAALTWKPQNTVPIDDEKGEKLIRMIETLNEHDDVQNV